MTDYSRLEGTGFGRRRLAGLRVAVVGLGALGNEVSRSLGLLGPASVLCIDPDIVENSNLTRSIFYRPSDVGQAKASAMVRALRERFPNTVWEEFAGEVADTGWERLAGMALLFGCLDRDSARLEMARISTRLRVPVSDGGLGGAHGTERGRVSYFPGQAGACFGCRLSAARRRELLGSWSSDAHPCGAEPGKSGRPSTPTMAAITGALQVELGLRALFEGRLESFSTEIDVTGAPRIETLQVAPSESCPFHEDRPAALMPVAGRFAEHLRPGRELSWEWPICTRARCQSCGNEWAPMLRRPRVRECPRCGSHRFSPLESVRRVDLKSPWAEKCPEAVGLPARHLYTVWEEVP